MVMSSLTLTIPCNLLRNNINRFQLTAIPLTHDGPTLRLLVFLCHTQCEG